uniref:Uncharacterized protein n=1 Tax=Amphimedon queenslandica TaxID=400682 RepID=A0A1X7TG54_AMPQE
MDKTKNITPAKIMQQEHVLSELYHYVTENPDKAVMDGSGKTLEYLEACNNIFKNVFLVTKKLLV